MRQWNIIQNLKLLRSS